ncbi:MAG: Crp/Fnr family transcriptional regulator [Rhodocyclaceae bacterium]|jgi:CRP/FNR family transcriptional regulator|nr:Crp/Fnr family transcriptional regulator [Rhodocyclaceae bacterium]
MTPDRAAVLELYPSLATLPPSVLERALQPSALMQLPAGTRLFAENQGCKGFPLLLAGSIKVIKSTASGREMLLYRVEPGGSCIITSSCLLGHTAYSASGVAETPLTLLVLPVPLFEQLIAESRPFREFVFHLFSARIAELMQLVEEVAFARLDRRLAKLLLSRESNMLGITHQQLAEELGSVREIVSRLLKGFAAQGLVSLGREQIVLLDRPGLKAIAAM